MADAYFFVDPVNGNDSTGTGALAAPVKTIGKAIGASGAFNGALTTSGVNYCALLPGIYREMVTLGATPTSTGPLVIQGDTDGAIQRAAGSTSPKCGLADWRGWSSDTVQLTTAPLLTAVGKSYVTLRNLKTIGSNSGGNGGVFNLSGSFSNWTCENCTFVATRARPTPCMIAGAAGAALNLIFDRCQFYGHPTGFGVDFQMPLNSAEYDMNAVLRNCLFAFVSNGVRLQQVGGSGAFYATGLRVQNCKFIGCSAISVSLTYPAGAVLATPSSVYNCEFEWCGGGVSCGHVSQLVEAGNKLECTTPRTVVAAGAGSFTTAIVAFDANDHLVSGQAPRPFGTPSPVNPGAGLATFGTTPTVDLANRPRPGGYGLAAAQLGCFERHDTAVKESTTTDAGDCARLVGPGDQMLSYSVNPASTTISVKCRYDANHGATTKPQVLLLACPELGVAAQTLTMSAAADTWETLTFASFTPSWLGAVRLLFVARPSAANGVFYFDTIT